MALDSRLPETIKTSEVSFQSPQPPAVPLLAERLSVLELGNQQVIALRENFKFKDHPDLKMSTKHLLFQCQEATDEPQMPFLIMYRLLYEKFKSPMSNFWCKLIKQ